MELTMWQAFFNEEARREEEARARELETQRLLRE
jgi:hypothetical protein